MKTAGRMFANSSSPTHQPEWVRSYMSSPSAMIASQLPIPEAAVARKSSRKRLFPSGAKRLRTLIEATTSNPRVGLRRSPDDRRRQSTTTTSQPASRFTSASVSSPNMRPKSPWLVAPITILAAPRSLAVSTISLPGSPRPQTYSAVRPGGLDVLLRAVDDRLERRRNRRVGVGQGHRGAGDVVDHARHAGIDGHVLGDGHDERAAGLADGGDRRVEDALRSILAVVADHDRVRHRAGSIAGPEGSPRRLTGSGRIR